MEKYVALEPQVDMVVFSGDQITANNVLANATTYWAEVVSVAAKHNIPFFSIFGNHDDMPFEPEAAAAPPRDPLPLTTREQLVAFETEKFPTLSWSRRGPLDLHGVSNFYVPVYDVDLTTPALVLFGLDSGGGTLNETVGDSQVSWLLNAARTFPDSVPIIVFVHIPPPEMATIYVPPTTPGSPCFGTLFDNEVTPTIGTNTLVSVLTTELKTRTLGVFFGHDHGNAFCCADAPPEPVNLCFGRHSGYGGYGDYARGTRVLKLTRRDGKITVSTWIRMEDGTINSAETL